MTRNSCRWKSGLGERDSFLDLGLQSGPDIIIVNFINNQNLLGDLVSMSRKLIASLNFTFGSVEKNLSRVISRMKGQVIINNI